MSTALSEDLDSAGDMPDLSSCKKGFLNRHTYTQYMKNGNIFKYDYEMLPIQSLWQVALKSSYKRVGVLRQTSSLL